MRVPVDDEHPLAAIGEVGGRHRHVVEQAEAHGPRRQGVVARRPNGQEGGVTLTPVEAVDRVDAGAGGPRPRRPTSRGRDRVGVDAAAAVRAEPLELVEVPPPGGSARGRRGSPARGVKGTTASADRRLARSRPARPRGGPEPRDDASRPDVRRSRDASRAVRPQLREYDGKNGPMAGRRHSAAVGSSVIAIGSAPDRVVARRPVRRAADARSLSHRCRRPPSSAAASPCWPTAATAAWSPARWPRPSRPGSSAPASRWPRNSTCSPTTSPRCRPGRTRRCARARRGRLPRHARRRPRQLHAVLASRRAGPRGHARSRHPACGSACRTTRPTRSPATRSSAAPDGAATSNGSPSRPTHAWVAAARRCTRARRPVVVAPLARHPRARQHPARQRRRARAVPPRSASSPSRLAYRCSRPCAATDLAALAATCAVIWATAVPAQPAQRRTHRHDPASSARLHGCRSAANSRCASLAATRDAAGPRGRGHRLPGGGDAVGLQPDADQQGPRVGHQRLVAHCSPTCRPTPRAAVTIAIPVQDPAQPARSGPHPVARRGRLPVVVELRGVGGGSAVDRFTTHLVNLPDEVTGAKLDRRRHPPGGGAACDSTPTAPAGSQRPGRVRSPPLVRRGRDLRATTGELLPQPETLQALAHEPRPRHARRSHGCWRVGETTRRSRRALRPAQRARLRGRPRERGAAPSAGTGATPPQRCSASRPTSTTAVVDDGLDDATVNRLARRRRDTRSSCATPSLADARLRLTLTQPFHCAAAPAAHRRGASADDGLAAHFTRKRRRPWLAATSCWPTSPSSTSTAPASCAASSRCRRQAWRAARDFLDAPARRPGIAAPPRTGRRRGAVRRRCRPPPAPARRAARRVPAPTPRRARSSRPRTSAGAGRQLVSACTASRTPTASTSSPDSTERILAAQSADLRHASAPSDPVAGRRTVRSATSSRASASRATSRSP